MKKIAILNENNIYYQIVKLLKLHFVPFVEGNLEDLNNPNKNLNQNTLYLFNIENIEKFQTYIIEEKTKKCDIFDVIFSINAEVIEHFYLYAKVLITSSNKIYNFSPFEKTIISFGFDRNSNITYSSIMEKNNLHYLMVYIQNSFNTLYNTKMIKFEFSITTSILENENLIHLLGVISLCLYLDVRFTKNEFIDFEKENIYVK